jgi:dihydrolipoamide dehydrogenase
VAGTYARTARVLVVGGGPAGYMAAIRLGQLGVPALLVERDEIGGECLNRGCIPSKALLHASGLFRAIGSEGPEIGVFGDGARFDLAKSQAWKDGVVRKERQGVASLLRSAGASVLKGTARFSGPKSAIVQAPDGGSERIDFDAALIAVGAVPVAPPGFEPDGNRVLNAWQLLSLSELPKSMLVLGGGVSGCELGEFLAQVGVRVTIVELLPQILPGLEADLAKELAAALGRLGIETRAGSRATALERSANGVRMHVKGPDGEADLEADRLFVTVGKRPETDDLDLEEAGVERDPNSGFVRVDDRMQTNVPGIYAAGDACRPPMLAHKAYREGIVAAEAIAGRPTRFSFQVVPSVVFTTPELATVGFTLAEARERGYPHAREVRFPYAALGRAHAAHSTDGWAKLVGDADSGLVLGAHVAGAGAGEFVAEAGFAIEMAARVRDLALTIHPHPTFSEALQEAALLWLEEPMHVTARKATGARSS